jgi:hypothetical protein
MGRLFIQMRDGQPYEHPITENNMRLAFPNLDLDNLPDTFAEFERVAPPELGPYEKNLQVSYELVDGKYKDVFTKENLTDAEKTAKQNQVKAEWADNNGYASWTFNEDTCAFEPPTPVPDDDKIYYWEEESLSWLLVE